MRLGVVIVIAIASSLAVRSCRRSSSPPVSFSLRSLHILLVPPVVSCSRRARAPRAKMATLSCRCGAVVVRLSSKSPVHGWECCCVDWCVCGHTRRESGSSEGEMRSQYVHDSPFPCAPVRSPPPATIRTGTTGRRPRRCPTACPRSTARANRLTPSTSRTGCASRRGGTRSPSPESVRAPGGEAPDWRKRTARSARRGGH